MWIIDPIRINMQSYNIFINLFENVTNALQKLYSLRLQTSLLCNRRRLTQTQADNNGNGIIDIYFKRVLGIINKKAYYLRN